MTIGLALVLNQSVLVVADGRITHALDAGVCMADDCNKIEIPQRHLVVAIGGVEMVSREAAEALQTCDLKQPRRVLAVAAQGLSRGWVLFRAAHPQEYDAHSQFMAALVVAGIDNFGKPYVGQVVQKQGAPMLVDGPHYGKLTYAIFSTDDAVTQHVVARLSEFAGTAGDDDSQTAIAVSAAMEGVIHGIAESSSTIGGIVRAVLLTSDGAQSISQSALRPMP